MRLLFFWLLLLSLTPVLAEETIEDRLADFKKWIRSKQTEISTLEAKTPRTKEDEAILLASRAELKLLREQEASTKETAKQIELEYNKTIGVSDVCPLHKGKMKPVNVPVSYGLLIFGPKDPLPEVRETHFPNAGTFFRGGCNSGSWSRKTATVYQCSKCRKAEADWKKQQK